MTPTTRHPRSPRDVTEDLTSVTVGVQIKSDAVRVATLTRRILAWTFAPASDGKGWLFLARAAVTFGATVTAVVSGVAALDWSGVASVCVSVAVWYAATFKRRRRRAMLDELGRNLHKPAKYTDTEIKTAAEQGVAPRDTFIHVEWEPGTYIIAGFWHRYSVALADGKPTAWRDYERQLRIKFAEHARQLALHRGADPDKAMIEVDRVTNRRIAKVALAADIPDFVRWEPPSKRTPVHQLPLGKGHRGRVVKVDLNDTPNILIVGGTGGGKTNILRALVATLIAHGYSIVGADGKRSGLSFLRSVRKATKDQPAGVYRHAVDPAAAVDVVNGVFTVMHQWYERKDRLADAGQPAPPPLNVALVIDEASVLRRWGGDDLMAKLAEIARLCREAGIVLIVAIQRPDATFFSTEIRENLQARIITRRMSTTALNMIGVSGAAIADDEDSQAGPNPLKHPGRAYVDLDGEGDFAQLYWLADPVSADPRLKRAKMDPKAELAIARRAFPLRQLKRRPANLPPIDVAGELEVSTGEIVNADDDEDEGATLGLPSHAAQGFPSPRTPHPQPDPPARSLPRSSDPDDPSWKPRRSA